jgi:KUP system potassium uptake protein
MPHREHHLTNCYHVVVRYGYLDAIDHGAAFVEDVVLGVVQHILDREGIGGPGAAAQLLAAMPDPDSRLGSFVKSLQLLPQGSVVGRGEAGGGKAGKEGGDGGGKWGSGAGIAGATAAGDVLVGEEGVVVVVPVLGGGKGGGMRSDNSGEKGGGDGGTNRAAACLSPEGHRVAEESNDGGNSRSGLIAEDSAKSCQEASAANTVAGVGGGEALRRGTVSMRRRSLGDAAGAASAAADAGYKAPEGSWYCPGVTSAKRLSIGDTPLKHAGAYAGKLEVAKDCNAAAAASVIAADGEVGEKGSMGESGVNEIGEWELTVEELQALRVAAGVVRSYRQRSVHLVGRVALKVQSRNVVKRVLLGGLYTFLHDAGRQLRDAWRIPPKKLVELGMEVVV